jgi:hypothetical protein
MKIKNNLYAKSHTINVWVKIILDKFNDLNFDNRENELANILGITSNSEIKKIKEASIIAFGRTLKVESYEDACNKLGVPIIYPQFINIDLKIAKRFLSEYKLTIIIKALNEGWYPNWNDSNEYKYMPYFKIENEGFSFWYTFYYTTTFVPSALLYKSNDLAIYSGIIFSDLYKDLLT